jgi:hypothetical protein
MTEIGGQGSYPNGLLRSLNVHGKLLDMDRCTCGPGVGGDRLSLWLIVVDHHSGRVFRWRPRPLGMHVCAFLEAGQVMAAWYALKAPSFTVQMRYAHSMGCLKERNPEFTFPELQPV